MTVVDLTSLHPDERGVIARGLYTLALTHGVEFTHVARAVTETGDLTIEDFDRLTDWQVLMVSDLVGAWDSAAAAVLRAIAAGPVQL